MLPFEIGIVLAYVTVPLVDWLNKWMPRPVAVGLIMLAEFLLVASFLAVLVPLVVNQVGVVLSDMPSQEERQSFFGSLVTSLKDILPPAAEDFAKNALQQGAQDIQQNATTYMSTALGVIGSAVLGIIGSISFALSLLVLPTWLFAVLR